MSSHERDRRVLEELYVHLGKNANRLPKGRSPRQPDRPYPRAQFPALGDVRVVWPGRWCPPGASPTRRQRTGAARQPFLSSCVDPLSLGIASVRILPFLPESRLPVSVFGGFFLHSGRGSFAGHVAREHSLPVCGSLCRPFTWVLGGANVFNSDDVRFISFFPVMGHLFHAVSTNPLPNPGPRRCVLTGILSFLCFTFKSVIRFEFIFV